MAQTLEEPVRPRDVLEPVDALFRDLRSRPEGLSSREAERRLVAYGANELVRRGRAHWPAQLSRQFTHPLALLLFLAAALAFAARRALHWAAREAKLRGCHEREPVCIQAPEASKRTPTGLPAPVPIRRSADAAPAPGSDPEGAEGAHEGGVTPGALRASGPFLLGASQWTSFLAASVLLALRLFRWEGER